MQRIVIETCEENLKPIKEFMILLNSRAEEKDKFTLEQAILTFAIMWSQNRLKGQCK